MITNNIIYTSIICKTLYKASFSKKCCIKKLNKNHTTLNYLFIIFNMLLIAVPTMYYSPLTQVSCMIIHKCSFHLHVTVRIGASDNLVTTARQMGLEKLKKDKN